LHSHGGGIKNLVESGLAVHRRRRRRAYPDSKRKKIKNMRKCMSKTEE